jgi:hypothetical protein
VDATAQPAPDEKNSRGLGSYVVWAFVAVMVYVLSFGPALQFTKGSFNVPLQYFYYPLLALYSEPPFSKPLKMWVAIWCPNTSVE